MERNLNTLPHESNITVQEVRALTGIGVSTIWRKAKEGAMPSPKRFGSRTFWKLGEVLEWLKTAGV